MRTSLLKRLTAVTACALFGAPAAAALASDRPERDFDADVVRAIERSEVGRLAKRPAATAPDTSGYDVTKYTIEMAVDFSALRLDSTVRVDAVTTAPNLSSVTLDFGGFTITRVEVDGHAAAFTRAGDVLRVEVGPFATSGQAFSVTVAYGGQPPTRDGLGFGFSSHGASTFAEPEGARLWFPCKDRPSDKARYEGFVTVPQSQVVASNGRLVDVTDVGGGRSRYHWLEEHPIATYLVMLAISNYRIIEQQAGDLPVRHYVYPELATAAQRDFARTPDMILAFQQRLGVAYPFDKYGHALFDVFGGAMEHQSMTSYSSRLITGDNRYDLVVAHELGHHWFGDLVSPNEWEEVWLNEGFATWMEFLWTEHADPDYLQQLMAGRETYFMNYEAGAGRVPLYGPGMNRLFVPTIYQKGGWVVSMLRYVVGDDAFFAGLQGYLNGHAFGNGSSIELKNAMEAASGMELDAFFDEWVFGVGYPTYEVSWSARAAGQRVQADLRIRQTQRGTPVFTTPLEVEVTYADGTSTRQRVQVAAADQIVSLCLDASPTRITVDPDNRILGTVTPSTAAVPAQPAACVEDPGPTNPVAITAVAFVKSKGKARLEVTGTGFVAGDSVVEVNGVALAKTQYGVVPEVRTLVGKQKGLAKRVVPRGVTVQITVFNPSSGWRSEPFPFTRVN